MDIIAPYTALILHLIKNTARSNACILIWTKSVY